MSDVREAAGPQMTTKAAPLRLADDCDISRRRSGANGGQDVD
ncbi:hypothetical protein ABT174_02310 [Streptomyces sparsogenes]